MKQPIKKTIKKWVAPLLCGLFTFLILKYVIFVGYVPSTSMEPTIKVNSIIFGSRIFGDFERGDIVIFHHEGYILVKRIAALPGDVVYINYHISTTAVNENLVNANRILTVPEDCYFMLGDNVEYSIDSRTWEDPFLHRKQIIVEIWKR